MVARLQPAAEPGDLRQLVLDQIREKPELGETKISVATEQGIITLTGTVRTKAERMAVETLAKMVPGVAALANDLEVKPARAPGSTEIAKDVLKVLRDHVFLAGEDIRVIVRDGCVTLEGTVHQELNKMLAGALVRRVPGILGVSNQLDVKPQARARMVIERIGVEGTGLSNDSNWVETGEAEAG
jgi:osmotically-inducible protein OsmY